MVFYEFREDDIEETCPVEGGWTLSVLWEMIPFEGMLKDKGASMVSTSFLLCPDLPT